MIIYYTEPSKVTYRTVIGDGKKSRKGNSSSDSTGKMVKVKVLLTITI